MSGLIPAWLWVLLVIGAVVRLTRLVVADGITEGLRARLTLAARRRRFAAWLTDLVTCPWCVSVWLGTLAAFVTVWWPDNRVILAGLVALTASLASGLIIPREEEAAEEHEEELRDEST